MRTLASIPVADWAQTSAGGRRLHEPLLERAVPAQPVQLFAREDEDPCIWQLHVQCVDQVGLLFKLCDLLGSHGVDINSADISSDEDGVVHFCFDLDVARPYDISDANDWCQELEEFIRRGSASGTESEAGSLASVSKRLSVNPDLLSVVAFYQILDEEDLGADVETSSNYHCKLPFLPGELRYRLELEGINQAGLLTYASFVIFYCGFSVVWAGISTVDGHVSDTFELSTACPQAEHRLRTHLDVPSEQPLNEFVALPFHATKSDGALVLLGNLSPPASPPSMSPRGPADSWNNSFCSPADNASDVPSVTFVMVGDGVNHDDMEQGSRHRASSASSTDEAHINAPPVTDEAHVNAPPAKMQATTNSMSSLQCPSAPSRPRNSSLDRTQTKQNKKAKSKKKTVYFNNGDEYIGECADFEGSEKRHGHGTYFYAAGTHETYKQYRGQWREDKKHGYGVFFYRGGGVYVGQWDGNQKHGLGVLLNTSVEADPMSMPSFRYEGQWFENDPHGLGAEESDTSSYFGHFTKGKRSHRGVCMKFARLGMSGCEALDGNLRLPLLDALDAEMLRLGCQKSSASSSTSSYFTPTARLAGASSQDHSFTRRTSMPSDLRLDLSTATNQAEHPRETQVSLPNIAFSETKSAGSGNSGSCATQETSNSSRTCSNSGGSPTPYCTRWQSHVPQDDSSQPTPQLWGSTVGRSRSLGPSSLSAGCDTLASAVSLQADAAGGSSTSTQGPVVFALCEENNLISPLPEDQALQEPEAETTPDEANLPRRSLQERKTDPAFPSHPTTDAEAQMPHQDGMHVDAEPPQFGRRLSTEQKASRSQRSPMLWSEEELAAFLACLGISVEVCQKLLQRKLKGVRHFLSMSNSEMRKDFGLSSPVERLTVRRALKRLLDVDRWENSIRGHKVADVLNDSVLGKYIVPFEELSLIAKISQGGYGTVHRGVLAPKKDHGILQASTSHLVAVKEMKGERRVRLHELLKEACVMASLSHPNICTFLGVCADSTDKKHYIISELMDCSLFDVIHQSYKLTWHGELTVSLVVTLSKGIVAGIGYLHGKNLVHADLKSPNILIDYSSSRQLVPRICDFGHTAMRTFPAPHHRCGTPHWAAPEVLRGESLSTAADVYSVGVIIWEMLAQKLPHKGLSFCQVLASVGWAGWTPDLELLPELPSEFRRLIKRCLSFTPAGRPSAKDVQRRLRQVPKHAQLKALRMLAVFFGIDCLASRDSKR